MLSTITSPLPLDVVIVHTESEVGHPVNNEARGPIQMDCLCAEQREKFVRQHGKRFGVFREMHSVQEFRLVLRAEVLELAEKHAVEMLNKMVEEEGMGGGLDYFQHRQLVMSRISKAAWAGVHLEPIPGKCWGTCSRQ